MTKPVVNVAADVQSFRGKIVADITSGFIVGHDGGAYLEFRFVDGTKAMITVTAGIVGQGQGQQSEGERSIIDTMEELTKDDLVQTCTKCEGTGKLENPGVSANQGSYGTHVVWTSPVDCDACAGHGIITTGIGKTLIEFFQLAKSKGLLS